MAPCHRKKKFGRLIDVDSASPQGFPVLKVLPLGFPRADWRLEKRESTTHKTHTRTLPTLPRYKIPRWNSPGDSLDLISFVASHRDSRFVLPSRVLTDPTAPDSFTLALNPFGIEGRSQKRFHEFRANVRVLFDL